jgi:hypothetical protein
LEGEHHDFESWINWIHRTTKKKTHDRISVYWKWLCQVYSILAKQPMDSFTTEQVRRVRRVPFDHQPTIDDTFRADHDVSRQSRQKDTLSAEDLGILLQWHWKYGTAAFTNERQWVQISLLMLFSAFTGSRPDTLLGDDSLSKNSQESSIDDSSDGTLADNSDGDTLVDDGSESNAQNTKRPGTVCYGDIELLSRTSL